MKWEKVKIGSICDINSGGTPSRAIPSYYNGDILWAKISDIENFENGTIKTTEEKITKEALASIGNRIFPKGSLLLAIYGSVGKVSITDCEMSTNQAILGIRPKNTSELDIRYLKYWFHTIKTKLSNRAVGGTLQNISLSIVKELPIHLPPLPIQHQIASILDHADNLRKLNKQLLQKYDELAQSVFIQMFGDPVRNEKGWPLVFLGEVIESIDAGSSYGGEEKELQEHELGVLKISAVTTGQFIPTEYKAVSKSLIRGEIIHPCKGDLLFSRANTRELVAATCIVDDNYSKLFLPDKLWRICLKNSKCNRYYLKFLLSEKNFRYELTKTATGTSGSMLNVSMAKLRNLKIPLPDNSVQLKFEETIDKITNQQKALKKGIINSENLFQSLMQRAFKEK